MSAKWRRSLAWDDRVFPPALWPVKALLRALSSIWLAVLTLALIALYLAAGSAPVVPLREAGELRWVHGWEPLEWTTDQYYSAWPLTALLALFIVNMIVATVRRIEFRWINSGVLTVHAGIVLLASGAAIDASSRVRGELFLAAGSPPEWADRFTVAGEIDLFIELDRQRSALLLRGLPRYRNVMPESGEVFASWRPEVPNPPTIEVVSYLPNATVREPYDPTRSSPWASWAVRWRGVSGDSWSGRVIASLQGPFAIRMPDGTRLEHTLLSRLRSWNLLGTEAPGTANAFVGINGSAGPRLVPAWPGAILEDAALNLVMSVVSIERESVIPLAHARVAGVQVSPAMVLSVRADEGDPRTVVLLADAPLYSYEIVDVFAAEPKTQLLNADPVLGHLSYLDTSVPALYLRGYEAIVRAPGGAVTGPFPIEQGGQIRFGDDGATVDLLGYTVRWMSQATPELAPPGGRTLAELATRLHAVVGVRVEGSEKTAWLPVSRWGIETREVALPDMRVATLGVATVERPLPGATIALDELRLIDPRSRKAPPQPHARVRVQHPGTTKPSPTTITLNQPLRWTAPREPATRLSRVMDAFAPVRWQGAIAGWDEKAPVRDEGGRFVLLSINSSAGVEMIAAGGAMIVLASPFALLLKPWLVRRRMAGGIA